MYKIAALLLITSQVYANDVVYSSDIVDLSPTRPNTILFRSFDGPTMTINVYDCATDVLSQSTEDGQSLLKNTTITDAHPIYKLAEQSCQMMKK